MAGGVGDMKPIFPRPCVFKNKLIKLAVVLDPEKPFFQYTRTPLSPTFCTTTKVLRGVCDKVGGFTGHVLGVTDTTYHLIQFLAPVARGNDDRLTDMPSEGFKDILAQGGEIVYRLLWRGVVNAVSVGSGRASELAEGKVFCQLHGDSSDR